MKVVLVTGGFDPLHSGHISYFKEAKKLGDKLVVGLNSDEWLTRKKGKPFMPIQERVEIIRNLKIINKFKLAKRLRPHKTCALMIETRGREVRLSHISNKTPTMRIRSGSSVNMFGGELHRASEALDLRIDND